MRWTERERSMEILGQDMRAWVAMEHESTCEIACTMLGWHESQS